MTIPPDVLRTADQLARKWDRSRSWVIAEAVRRMGTTTDPAAGLPALVAEPAVEPYLAPSERLHQAEGLADLARKVRPRTTAHPGLAAEATLVAGQPLSTVPALDPFRLQQLEADLALSPLERVIAAERVGREVRRRSFANLIVSFDRPEDYLAWKTLEATGVL